uniref:Zgc:162396 n=1 Tax=Sinocyclocheilus anshuiensis TaxID=1608454 RepID=A0A671KLW0_9TELE
MTERLFEEKRHASLYQKYRFGPPDELKKLVLHYLDKKVRFPHQLAVDLGCGTGQNSCTLTAYFEQVVGIDVSESQVEQARAVSGFPNLSYRGAAIPDGSVDLLTAASAAHWFDAECFIKEATHVLKPRGCLALFGYGDNMKIHYESCGDRLNNIYEEVSKAISNYNYTSSKITGANSKLKILFETIPFFVRIEIMPIKQQLSIKNAVGFIQIFSMYQAYLRANPSAATALLERTTSRILEEMKVSSTEAKVDFIMKYFCVLACKPE